MTTKNNDAYSIAAAGGGGGAGPSSARSAGLVDTTGGGATGGGDDGTGIPDPDSNPDDITKGPIIEWSMYNEELLAEWCDIAQCYKWLHMQSHHDYQTLHTRYTIPSIIMSTTAGAASFASLSFAPEIVFYSSIAIGTINIFVGMLSAIQQYLHIAEYKEAHLSSSIAWDKLVRNIKIELSKRPRERMDPAHFIKISRHDFDRLMESGPVVNQNIVDRFIATFSGGDSPEKQELFDQLAKPDICNSIISINSTRRKWFEDPCIATAPDVVQPPLVSSPATSMTTQFKRPDTPGKPYTPGKNYIPRPLKRVRTQYGLQLLKNPGSGTSNTSNPSPQLYSFPSLTRSKSNDGMRNDYFTDIDSGTPRLNVVPELCQLHPRPFTTTPTRRQHVIPAKPGGPAIWTASNGLTRSPDTQYTYNYQSDSAFPTPVTSRITLTDYGAVPPRREKSTDSSGEKCLDTPKPSFMTIRPALTCNTKVPALNLETILSCKNADSDYRDGESLNKNFIYPNTSYDDNC